MENLRIIENELVPVYITDKGERVVYGTELHSALKVKSKFSDWVKNRLNDCEAQESKEFEAFSKNLENGGRVIEYIIRLATAKEMAMLERNAKGKQVRRYFIRIEEKYKNQNAPLTIQQQIQTIAKGADELYQRVDKVENRIVQLEDTMNLDHGQQYFLGQTVSKTVITALGSKESQAYKEIGRKVFAECNGDLKRYFKVNARMNIPRKRYEEAIAYAERWRPSTNTQMLIEQHNAQQSLNFEEGGGNQC